MTVRLGEAMGEGLDGGVDLRVGKFLAALDEVEGPQEGDGCGSVEEGEKDGSVLFFEKAVAAVKYACLLGDLLPSFLVCWGSSARLRRGCVTGMVKS